MPGLLAVSWAPDAGARAAARFVEAADAWERLKGLARTDELALPAARIARFAAPFSPARTIVVGPGPEPVRVAAAGWWSDPTAPPAEASSAARIAARFAADGERALDALEGHYAVVVVADPAGRRLVGAVDQLALFPVYVAETDGAAWLSTSAAALACALRPPLDVDALRALFLDNAIRSPRSAFAGIRRVALGERVVLEEGRLRVARAWSPYRPERAYRRIEDAADDGAALLRDVCARLRSTWPRLVADLTSGLDSRLVVAALATGDAPVAVTVNGPPDNVDVAVARDIATRFGWPLRHHALPADWGGRRWPLFVRGVALAEGELPGHAVDGTLDAKTRLAPDFDASLTGGGGELFREFFWQQEYLRIGRTSALDVERLLRYRFFPSVDVEPSLFVRDWRPAYVADQARVVEELVARAPDARNTAKLDAVYMWKSSGHVGRYAGAVWPLVAAPAPLATARMVEFGTTVPWRFRMSGQLVRHMITRMHPALAAVPTCYGGSAEPIRFGRPSHVARYVGGQAARLVRKLGTMTVGHPIIPNPTARVPEPGWERDLVARFAAEGLLDVARLRTASLYDADGLRRFLARAAAGERVRFATLGVIVSIELLCRTCGVEPRGERL